MDQAAHERRHALKPALFLLVQRRQSQLLHLMSGHHKHSRGHVTVCTYYRVIWEQLVSTVWMSALYTMCGLLKCNGSMLSINPGTSVNCGALHTVPSGVWQS